MYFLNFLLLLLFLQHINGAIRIDEDYKWKKKVIKIYCPPTATITKHVIRRINRNTCLRLRVSKVPLNTNNSINIFYHPHSCFTRDVGATPDRPNRIFATNECLKNSYVMLFLLFRTLGLSYEHNRDDRDKYVSIRPPIDITPEDNKTYFFKDKDVGYNTTTFGLNYDYGSIMHGDYKFHAAKIHRLITIFVRSRYSTWYYKTLGYSNKVSFNEYRLINYLYCNKTCKNHTLEFDCKRNGYQDPRNCAKCKCPYPFNGDDCWGILKSDFYCAEIYLIPQYEYKHQWYKWPKNCYITFEAKWNQRIEIVIYYLYFYYYDNKRCTRDTGMGVEILYKTDKSVMGLFLCAAIDNYYGHVTLISESNLVFMVYRGISGSDTIRMKYRAIVNNGLELNP
uniref:Astacin domain-containing protein n=1 Tax=Parastrongyloides trichosuri TaxID=131310 RepID=A0A0N4ZD87_PARTI